MDSPTVTPRSAPSSNDENLRVKFLCSFSGNILPRPKMVNFDMSEVRRDRECPSRYNLRRANGERDDVINMMEEYDKLGSGDGFTRLRIFLFAHPDQDGSLHFVDGDERDNERRYVDALNSLNDSPDFRSPGELGSFDDVHAAEQYFNQMNLDGSIHGQRNMELPMAQMNLRHLTIPHLGSGQLQQAVNQRYSEMEAPWSPAYYSPRQPANMDQRPVAEFPTSPSSSRYRSPYGDFSDKSFERVPEDYNRPPINTHSIYEQQPQYSDNVVLIPAGPVVNEKAGFPGNILQGSNAYEGNSICENCRMTFQRNQVYPEQPHVEPTNVGNGYLHVPNSCAECPPNREVYLINSDANLHHPYYCRDQNDPRPMYSETHGHERGWVSPHQPPHPWAEEPRPHLSVSGRLTDGYVMENGMSIPVGHGNVCDGHHVQSHYVHHEDQRYARPGVDYGGSQVFQDQAVATGSQVHLPSMEDRGVRYGNPNYPYGTDNVYQVPHGHIPPQSPWRNVHGPFQGGPAYETPVSSQLVNGSVPMGFIRYSGG
ncbi:hypothetical protein DH2020_014113 [Rehmannia glutinosa]|uniref:Uncharacterized protein n=1 Tax=Rehmannia glutinosa TaxID=99300 RepID=A0ABR0WVF2_REHGL